MSNETSNENWYDKEVVRDNTSYEKRPALNLNSGVHTIKFLSEGNEIASEWEGKIIPKRVFEVQYDGKPYAWFVPKGATKSSLFGQIVEFAKNNHGLVGAAIQVIVGGSGKDKRYSIKGV